MDFVHEQQGGLPRRPPCPRCLERLLQVGDAGENRRKLLKLIARRVGQEARDGGLADTGRTPKDHRRQSVRRRHPPDRSFGAEQVLLAHHVG